MKDNLRQGGVSFCDNSGSTCGAILKITQELNTSLGPAQTALWNHRCEALKPSDCVTWESTGCTEPSKIFELYPDIPDKWTSFILVTDGSVGSQEIQKLGVCAHLTAHLPSILVVVGSNFANNFTVSSCNISVLMSHFNTARTCLLLVVDKEDALYANQPLPLRSTRIHVLAAKGVWAEEFGVLPDLSDDPFLTDCPLTTPEKLHALNSIIYPRQPPGTICVEMPVQTPREDMPLKTHYAAHFYYKRLLEESPSLDNLPTLEKVLSHLTSENLETPSRRVHAAGPSYVSKFRNWIGLVLQSCTLRPQQALFEKDHVKSPRKACAH